MAIGDAGDFSSSEFDISDPAGMYSAAQAETPSARSPFSQKQVNSLVRSFNQLKRTIRDLTKFGQSEGISAFNKELEKTQRIAADLHAEISGITSALGGISGGSFGYNVPFAGGPTFNGVATTGAPGSGRARPILPYPPRTGPPGTPLGTVPAPPPGSSGTGTPNGGQSRAQRAFEWAAGGGLALAGAYVGRNYEPMAMTDLAYNRVAYAGAISQGRSYTSAGTERIRQEAVRAGAGGALSAQDYAQGVRSVMFGPGGGFLPDEFTSGLRHASTIAQLAPGVGLTGGAAGMAELYSPQTVNTLRGFLGISARPGGRERPPAEIFRDVRQRLGIRTERDLQAAFQPGTARYATLGQFINQQGELGQAFFGAAQVELGGTRLSNDPVRQREQLKDAGLSDTLISTMLDRSRTGIERRAAIEDQLVDQLSRLNVGIANLNTLIGNITGNNLAGNILGGVTGTVGVGGGAGGLLNPTNLLLLATRNRGAGAAAAAGASRLGGLGMFGIGALGGLAGGAVGTAASRLGGENVAASTAIGAGSGALAGGLLAAGLGALLTATGIGAPIGIPLIAGGAAIGGLLGGVGGYGRARGGVGDPMPSGPTRSSGMGLHPALRSNVARMFTDNPRLVMNSGVRSEEAQRALFGAGISPAPPGTSRHESGEAVDVGPPSEYRWLQANAHRYGLEHISDSEPWHLERAGSRGPVDKYLSRSREWGAGDAGTSGVGTQTPVRDPMDLPNYGLLTASQRQTETGSLLAQYVWGRFPEARIISAYRPGSRVRGSGSRSFHADAQAIDVAGPTPTEAGYGDTWLRQIYEHFMAISPMLDNVILSDAPQWVKRGGGSYPARTSGTAYDDHHDHVHVGMAARKALPNVALAPVLPAEGGGGLGRAPSILSLSMYGSIESAEAIRQALAGRSGEDSREETRRPRVGSGVSAFSGDTSQLGIARTIYQVARQLGMYPSYPKALLAAIETGLVESNLTNVPHGDRDSLGVFQQRTPWGSVEQRMDPAAAARAFFQGGASPGTWGVSHYLPWAGTSGQLAQRVQVSAYPARYDQRRGEALGILSALGVDLAHVSDPHPGGRGFLSLGIGDPMPASGLRDMGTVSRPVSIDMGGPRPPSSFYAGTTRSVHIGRINMTVQLANGSLVEAERLMRSIQEVAENERILAQMGTS